MLCIYCAADERDPCPLKSGRMHSIIYDSNHAVSFDFDSHSHRILVNSELPKQCLQLGVLTFLLKEAKQFVTFARSR